MLVDEQDNSNRLSCTQAFRTMLHECLCLPFLQNSLSSLDLSLSPFCFPCSHCAPCSERRKRLFVQDPLTCKCSCKFTQLDCKSRQLELNERTCRFVYHTYSINNVPLNPFIIFSPSPRLPVSVLAATCVLVLRNACFSLLRGPVLVFGNVAALCFSVLALCCCAVTSDLFIVYDVFRSKCSCYPV